MHIKFLLAAPARPRRWPTTSSEPGRDRAVAYSLGVVPPFMFVPKRLVAGRSSVRTFRLTLEHTPVHRCETWRYQPSEGSREPNPMADETSRPDDVVLPEAAVAPVGVSEGGGGQTTATGLSQHLEALMPPEPGTGLSVSLAEVVGEGLGGGRLGHAGIALLRVSTARLERDIDVLRQERDSAGHTLTKCKDDLALARQRSAVLGERLKSEKRRKWFHDVLPAVGGVIVTLATPDLAVDGELNGSAIVLLVIGIALIVHRLFLAAPGADVEVE